MRLIWTVEMTVDGKAFPVWDGRGPWSFRRHGRPALAVVFHYGMMVLCHAATQRMIFCQAAWRATMRAATVD
jgi:hypothetical protein